MAKRPRPRKRGSKKAGDTDGNAIVDGEEAGVPAGAPALEAPALALEERPAADDAVVPPAPRGTHPKHDSDSDSEQEQGAHKKRKRSRKRKNPYADPQPGPDPASIEGLGEAAQRGLVYTQEYLRDRSAWKFSKPRQNWLMRHILWSPSIHEAATALMAVPEKARGSLPGDVQTMVASAAQVPEAGSWVPDEHVAVVSVYLQSMMGLAKQRMLEMLQGAAGSTVPAPPSYLAEQARNATGAAKPNTYQVGQPAEGDAADSGDEASNPSQPVDRTEAEAAARIANESADLLRAYAEAARWCTERARRASEALEWIEARDSAL